MQTATTPVPPDVPSVVRVSRSDTPATMAPPNFNDNERNYGRLIKLSCIIVIALAVV